MDIENVTITKMFFIEKTDLFKAMLVDLSFLTEEETEKSKHLYNKIMSKNGKACYDRSHHLFYNDIFDCFFEKFKLAVKFYSIASVIKSRNEYDEEIVGILNKPLESTQHA